MAALLGVGEVIMEQAHAPALRGGGDLVVGGAFGPVESARFVLAHVLGGPELRPRRVAASPTRRATLYLITPAAALPIAARGGIPSLERAVGDPEIAGIDAWRDEPADATWSNPRPEDILRSMDRFHPEPQSPAAGPDPIDTKSAPLGSDPFTIGDNRGFRSSWAEWLYFNGRSADGRLRVYLTFLAGGRAADGRRSALVRLQLDREGHSTNYSAAAAVDDGDVVAHAPDLDIANNHVRVDGSTYRITVALNREPAGPGLTGEIVLDAPPGRSVPPAAIHGAHGWISGYVVPVLSGGLHGTLRIGAETIPLDGATGYHDHNWGYWAGVRWQWGQVAGEGISIVFGRVFPPATVADPDRAPGVLAVLGPNGPIGFSTDVSIAEDGEGGAPRHIDVNARGSRVELHLNLSVEEVASTRMALTRLADGTMMTFLQLGGTYRVDGRAGDRTIGFTTRGSAETFR